MSLEPRPHQAMREGAEFDTIRALMARWGDLAVDIGDDAAVLAPPAEGTRVVSVDACVEDVHFRRAWISAREVGVRAAVAALSDLAAMGARAEYVLIAFVIPDAWREQLSDVADGMGAVIREAGARIVGGNLSRGAVFSITTTVIGRARRVVPRSGAREGDLVVVTGLLGGPGAAIQAWDAGESPTAWSRGRFAAPAPRWAEGEALAAAGATAAPEHEAASPVGRQDQGETGRAWPRALAMGGDLAADIAVGRLLALSGDEPGRRDGDIGHLQGLKGRDRTVGGVCSGGGQEGAGRQQCGKRNLHQGVLLRGG